MTLLEVFYAGISLLVALSVFAVLTAVLIDFIEIHKKSQTKKEKKSIVATGTMLLFFMLFYAVIRLRLGQVPVNPPSLRMCFVLAGLALVITGAITNILGRLALGRNWANHIKIYSDHALVSGGAYKIVRHPLYASLIWMFLGASLVYLNYLAFLANAIIFVPFMYYRAKQEEDLLSKEFEEYKDYQKNVGMFFPKIFRRTKT